jgi:hypothetical protein
MGRLRSISQSSRRIGIKKRRNDSDVEPLNDDAVLCKKGDSNQRLPCIRCMHRSFDCGAVQACVYFTVSAIALDLADTRYTKGRSLPRRSEVVLTT